MDGRSQLRVLAGVAFLAALWLPLGASVTGLSRTALLPTEGGEDPPSDLAGKTDRWLRERTGFRAAAIGARREILVHALGESAHADLSFGRDGWIFYAPRRPAEAIARREDFSAGRVRYWRRVLEARASWLRRHGIAYVPMIVPDKETIYPDRAPELARWPAGTSPLDRLVAALDGRLELVDVRQVLRREREEGIDVYDASDSHWNRFGASFGYRALAERIAKEGFPIRPIEVDRAKLAPREVEGGDLAELLGIEHEVVDRTWEVPTPPRLSKLVVVPSPGEPLFLRWPEAAHLVTENPSGELGRAVVFRDSSATRLLHWLPLHFRHARISWLNPRSAAFAWSIVREERPEIVIDVFVERKLLHAPYLGPDDPADRQFDPDYVPPGSPDGPA
jgi:alginate O-acetyltransferase complex protein AlgJ